jgi:hypothetical protein
VAQQSELFPSPQAEAADWRSRFAVEAERLNAVDARERDAA